MSISNCMQAFAIHSLPIMKIKNQDLVAQGIIPWSSWPLQIFPFDCFSVFEKFEEEEESCRMCIMFVESF